MNVQHIAATMYYELPPWPLRVRIQEFVASLCTTCSRCAVPVSFVYFSCPTILCHLRDFDAINCGFRNGRNGRSGSNTLLCCCIWRARFTVFAIAIAVIVVGKRCWCTRTWRHAACRRCCEWIAIHGDQAAAAAIALRGAGGG